MNSEWDNTPWAGTAAQSARKAVTGPGVVAYATDIPLQSYYDTPQKKAAAFLRAYKMGWFYKAESKISADLAKMKISLAPENSAGDNQTAIVEQDLMVPWEALDPLGQFLRLMEKPNPSQTGRDLRRKTFIRRDMAGIAFWYKEYGFNQYQGLPTALYGISPARMTPSYNKAGVLIGWVMDADQRGKAVPFETYEITVFANPSADDELFGVGVVEAVYAELPLTDLMARHTTDLLSTGGRLAGMMWPKDSHLDEDQFQDAQKAWRNMTSDPQSARRMLIFPEPMEYSAGASTPADIGIPDLAALNRDNILTAFPISPYILGVPEPGGLNSGELKRQGRRAYHEDTLSPRVDAFEEVIQSDLIPLYEAVVGYTLDFEVEEPNLDDATTLTEKVAALRALVNVGADAKEAVEAVGLDHIKFDYTALLPTPQPTQLGGAPADQTVSVTDRGTGQRVAVNETLPTKSRAEDDADHVLAPATDAAFGRITSFFYGQRDRTVARLHAELDTMKAKGARSAAIKASPPKWWDAEAENAALRETMRTVYLQVGRGGLQTVSDLLDRSFTNKNVSSVANQLLSYGASRIADINAKTLQALVTELAIGAQRGYSISQLIDGVPDEGFKGVMGVTLDNGTPAFSELRAETIARTETMLSYNRANIEGYAQFGVERLLAYDGDGDEMCAARNGLEFTVDEALGIEDHPNGTLTWAPVVDKAVHEPAPQPWVINNFIEPAKAPDVHIVNQTPEVYVASPSVTVEPSKFQVDVHVPEPKPTTKTVKRNDKGEITAITETPATEN